MPWRECTRVSERLEMIRFSEDHDVPVSELARRFGVSRKTVYKWLSRHEELGQGGLADRSRKPLTSPGRSSVEVETIVCELRAQHPAWGGRKLHHRLVAMGIAHPPAPSTITGILRRHGLLDPERRIQRDWQRFEADAANDLWQMDYKGHIPTGSGRCHPLTALDDHSRFNVILEACSDERAETVQGHLIRAFQRYGLPRRMLMDNGSPWGSDLAHPHTRLTAWLIRLGISVSHGRPYHPQTQGKEERFHRSLALEVLRTKPWPDLVSVQHSLDEWRQVYNFERPHEALGDRPPASRYAPSTRSYPASLPEIIYERGDPVRKVQDKGRISFQGREYRVGRAFIGEPVTLKAVENDRWDVYYCHQFLVTISPQDQPTAV